MTTEIEQAIIDNTAQPKKAAGDAGSIENHSLKDQIEVAKNTGKATSLGVKLLKPQPGRYRLVAMPDAWRILIIMELNLKIAKNKFYSEFFLTFPYISYRRTRFLRIGKSRLSDING